MKDNVWTWSIACEKGQFSVELRKHSLKDELLEWLGGQCIRYSASYGLGNRILCNLERSKTFVVLTLPIDEDQARILGWYQ